MAWFLYTKSALNFMDFLLNESINGGKKHEKQRGAGTC